MKTVCPRREQLPQLRALWQEAFGDDDAFLDRFFSLAFAPERCRCVTDGEKVAAALYIIPAECAGQPLAYLYAVATADSYRGRGLCRALFADTKAYLREAGFCGALLVPENAALAGMYEKMGFSFCSAVSEFVCSAAGERAEVRQVGGAEYAALRRALLPPGGVIEEGAALRLLASNAKFYAGADFVAAVQEGTCCELLGNKAAAPHLARALGLECMRVRAPGEDRLFAMLCPLTDACPEVAYFGLALD